MGKIKRNTIVINSDYAEIIIKTRKQGIKKVKIDIEDIEKIKDFTWCWIDSGTNRNAVYIQSTSCNIYGKRIKLHRLIMSCPEDKVIDHINRDTLDNRKDNLRICTQADNIRNRTTFKNNTSGCTGVTWEKDAKRWRVRINIDNKEYNLGYYKDYNKAVNVRKQIL